MIWSAIGNTTNLAARLQSLTRELDASVVVIDRRTRDRAQVAAAGFEQRSHVPVRGRRETQDVYALPLPRDRTSRRWESRGTGGHPVFASLAGLIILLPFFPDPWNAPERIRDHGEPGASDRLVFLYSFGPNRRRDSVRDATAGDGVGVVLANRRRAASE